MNRIAMDEHGVPLPRSLLEETTYFLNYWEICQLLQRLPCLQKATLPKCDWWRPGHSNPKWDNTNEPFLNRDIVRPVSQLSFALPSIFLLPVLSCPPPTTKLDLSICFQTLPQVPWIKLGTRNSSRLKVEWRIFPGTPVLLRRPMWDLLPGMGNEVTCDLI